MISLDILINDTQLAIDYYQSQMDNADIWYDAVRWERRLGQAVTQQAVYFAQKEGH